MVAELPLVLVEWVDSTQPTSPWQWLSDVKAAAVRCQTVGFLINDGTDVKVIAQNVGDCYGPNRQVSGVITIPACSVKRVTKLAVGTGQAVTRKAGAAR